MAASEENNLGYPHSAISTSKQLRPEDEDSDEDLEALRLAALQSRKSLKNEPPLPFGSARNNQQAHMAFQYVGIQNWNRNNKIPKWRQRASNLIVINTIPSENPKLQATDVFPPLALPQNKYVRITPERVLVKSTDNNGPKKFSRLESNSDDSDYDDSSSSESEKSSEEDQELPIESKVNVEASNLNESECELLLTEDSSCDFQLSQQDSATLMQSSDSSSCNPNKESAVVPSCDKSDSKRAHSPVSSNSSKENASQRSLSIAENDSHLTNKRSKKINGNSISLSVSVKNPKSNSSRSESHCDRTNSSFRALVPHTSSSEGRNAQQNSSDHNVRGDEERPNRLFLDSKSDLRLVLKSKRGMVENNTNTKDKLGATENSADSKAERTKERQKRQRSLTPDSPPPVRSVLSVVRVKNIQKEVDKDWECKRKSPERKERKRRHKLKEVPTAEKTNRRTLTVTVEPALRQVKEPKQSVHMRLGVLPESHKSKLPSEEKSDRSTCRSKPSIISLRTKKNHSSNRKMIQKASTITVKGDYSSGLKR